MSRKRKKKKKSRKVSDKDPLKTKIINALLRKFPKIRAKVKSIKNQDKKIYYIRVWIITESQPIKSLKNSDKRGFRKYHLDHICPISWCYYNDIPPEIAGDITNLQFLHWRKNIDKGDSINEVDIQIIMERVGRFSGTSDYM